MQENWIRQIIQSRPKIANLDDAKKWDFSGINNAIANGGKYWSDHNVVCFQNEVCHSERNGNGDTLPYEEIMQRAQTMLYKPIKLEHTRPILGTITDAFASDDEGVASLTVAGMLWGKEEGELIQEIISGIVKDPPHYYTSMEAGFNPTETEHYINDREVTPDEYLQYRYRYSRERPGTFERVLRGVTFGGIGVVKDPADPATRWHSFSYASSDDITKEDVAYANIMKEITDGAFDTKSTFAFPTYIPCFNTDSVFANDKEATMTKEMTITAEELERIKKDAEAAAELKISLQKKIDEVDVLSKKIQELEAAIATKDTEKEEALAAAVAATKEDVVNEIKAELEEKYSKLQEEYDAVKAENDKFKKDIAIAERVARIEKVGCINAEDEDVIALINEGSEEEFTRFVNVLSKITKEEPKNEPEADATKDTEPVKEDTSASTETEDDEDEDKTDTVIAKKNIDGDDTVDNSKYDEEKITAAFLKRMR